MTTGRFPGGTTVEAAGCGQSAERTAHSDRDQREAGSRQLAAIGTAPSAKCRARSAEGSGDRSQPAAGSRGEDAMGRKKREGDRTVKSGTWYRRGCM